MARRSCAAPGSRGGYGARVRYYVHGAGRSGHEAWPHQAATGGVFADHSSADRMVDRARLVAEQCPDDVALVVSHSLGAVAVALAQAAGTLPAAPHVLVEPALYDVARGEGAVESHVAPMDAARARAAGGDLYGFWETFAPMMLRRAATRDAWPEDRSAAERFAAMEPPWGHDVDASVFAGVPTLVVTGGWNDEYEAIAGRLQGAGARHVVLPGARHRPHDLPEFEGVVGEFLETGR